jgi:ATP-dependent DNA helicase RecQ
MQNSFEKAQKKLQEIFGHQSFRGVQEPVLKSLFSGHNSLALMPTGTGKSLCYQLPAFVEGDLCLVVSPLIALMQDQVDELRAKGLPATFINSSLGREDREKRQVRLKKGEYKIVYCTPERFLKEDFWQSLETRTVSWFAIDEAHCISQWGHDFRPEFSRLGEIKQRLGNPVTLALTATATPTVAKDICEMFHISGEHVFDGGLDRPNLKLNVHSVYGMDEKIRNLVGLSFQVPGAQIVYISLISTLYKVSEHLEKLNVPHLIYHGDLPPQERRRQQERFMEQDQLILATPAFGLGVNKPNVRLLVHFEVPSSIEAYFQEVGRAGRDGQMSQCHLFYDQDDVSIQTEFLKWAHPDAGFIETVYRLIERNPGEAESQGNEYLRRQMNFYNSRDYRVETTINLLERWGCLEKTQAGRFGRKPVQPPSKEWLAPYEKDERLRRSTNKLLQMVQYAEAESGCRVQMIREYFGKPAGDPCGQCDLEVRRTST